VIHLKSQILTSGEGGIRTRTGLTTRRASNAVQYHYATSPIFTFSISNLKFEMAERVGFEPTVPVRVQRFSRPPDSATLAPLHINYFKLLRKRIITLRHSLCHCTVSRFFLKNNWIKSRQSSAKTPEVTSARWFKELLVQIWRTESTAPALGSGAP
jgi:hypothetical protein